MGCDIHFVIEKQLVTNEPTSKWVGVYTSDYTPNMARNPADRGRYRTTWCDNRDYRFFAKIAGVRGPGPKANGLPEDASELTTYCFDSWGMDGHSCGHMPLLDFMQAKIDTNEDAVKAAEVTRQLTDTNDGRWEWERAEPLAYTLADLAYYSEGGAEGYRVVFWFDN